MFWRVCMCVNRVQTGTCDFLRSKDHGNATRRQEEEKWREGYRSEAKRREGRNRPHDSVKECVFHITYLWKIGITYMQSIECVCACRHTFARAGRWTCGFSSPLLSVWERWSVPWLLIPVPRSRGRSWRIPRSCRLYLRRFPRVEANEKPNDLIVPEDVEASSWCHCNFVFLFFLMKFFFRYNIISRDMR